MLDLIHSATLAVADEVGWDKTPFEAAYQRVAADPRFRRCRPWKPNRARTARARVVFEELPEQVVAFVEVEDADGLVSMYGPAKTSYAYVRGAWAETRDLVWERDSVVLRLKDGTELLRVRGVGAPGTDAGISHHPGWVEYSSKFGNLTDLRDLTAWAVACAHRVLPIFEDIHPQDMRPRVALVGAQSFVRGDMRVEVAGDLAALASAAAAEAREPACIAAARACERAAGVPQMASRAKSVSAYALKALEFAGRASPADLDAERAWQVSQLPERFTGSIFPDV